MDIVYTLHASQRMGETERRISEEDVRAVLEHPDVQRPGKAGARIADRTIGGRRISVVYRLRGESIIVITVVVL